MQYVFLDFYPNQLPDSFLYYDDDLDFAYYVLTNTYCKKQLRMTRKWHNHVGAVYFSVFMDI